MSDDALPSGGEPEPPWHLLPRQPLGFFGLEPGFDAKELKRRYGRLIKRYKPERDPDAFQKIRAAYEALTAGGPAPAPPRVTAPEAPDAQEEAADGAPASPTVDDELAARLEHEPPAVVQRALAALEPAARTPGHYLALALLAGAPGVTCERGPLDWLLEGARAWPGEPRLLTLLHAHLSREVELERAHEVLRRCAGALDRQGFYRVTASIWRRWVRAGPTDAVAAALDECERLLPLGGDRGVEPWFLLGLLRPVAVRAGDDWLRALVTRLEARGDEAPDLDLELEIAHALRGYGEARAAFLAAGDPLRAQVDATIVGLADAAPGSVEAYLRLMTDVVADPALALAALPAGHESARRAVEALRWLGVELARAGIGRRLQPAPVPTAALERVVRQGGGLRRFALVAAAIVAPVVALVAALTLILVFYRVAASFRPGLVVLAALLFLLFRTRAAALANAVPTALTWARADVWLRQRAALAALVTWSHQDVDGLVTKCGGGVDDVRELARNAARDPGIALVELAQRFGNA